MAERRVLELLAHKIGFATRIAQRQLEKISGKGARAEVFRACDYAIAAAKATGQPSALGAHRDDTTLGSTAPSSTARDLPWLRDPWSSSDDAKQPTLDVMRAAPAADAVTVDLEELVQDRLECIAPVLRAELLAALAPSGMDPVVDPDAQLRRNVAAHPRQKSASYKISSLDRVQLRSLQRGYRSDIHSKVDELAIRLSCLEELNTVSAAMRSDPERFQAALNLASAAEDPLPTQVEISRLVDQKLLDFENKLICEGLLTRPLAATIGFEKPITFPCDGGSVCHEGVQTPKGPDSGSGIEHSSAYVIGAGRGRGGGARDTSIREVGPVSDTQQCDLATGNADSDAETDDSGSGIENPSAYVIGAGRGRRGLTKPVAFGTYRHSAICRSLSGS